MQVVWFVKALHMLVSTMPACCIGGCIAALGHVKHMYLFKTLIPRSVPPHYILLSHGSHVAFPACAASWLFNNIITLAPGHVG